jgi:stage II sporulation protein E
MVKYGAATTYVCRGNWMECIKSTSLPVGVMEDAGCECSSKKYYAGDLIVMVSDGVLDSILFENKDDYMHTLLEALKDEEPETVVEAVIQDIRSVCGKRLKDDATIIVCKVMKNL